MGRGRVGLLVGGFLISLGACIASAAPVISVDMAPSTVGIQSTVPVTAGATLTVDAVLADAGLPTTPTVFDTMMLEMSFNDLGPVLGRTPTGPTWLAPTLATDSPFTLDIFAGADLLSPSLLPSDPGVGSWRPSSGSPHGSAALGLLDPLAFAVLPSVPVGIFSLDFTARPRESAFNAGAATPPGSPRMNLRGIMPTYANLVQSAVNVVPKPGTMLLLGSGLAGLVGYRRSRHKKSKRRRKRRSVLPF